MSQSELDQQREGQSFNDQQQSDAMTNNKIKKRKKNKHSLVCKHCDREFQTLQALGGHQTAHKQEREAVKRSKIERGNRKSTLAPKCLETLEVDHHPANYFLPLHGISGFPPSWPGLHYLVEDGRVFPVGSHYLTEDGRVFPVGPVAGFLRPYTMVNGPTKAWFAQRSPPPETHTNSHNDDKEQISSSSSVTDLDLTLKL